jgi:hypothetical protein
MHTYFWLGTLTERECGKQENKFVALFNAALATVQVIGCRENNVKIYLRELS